MPTNTETKTVWLALTAEDRLNIALAELRVVEEQAFRASIGAPTAYASQEDIDNRLASLKSAVEEARSEIDSR